ncbi:MAG: DUF4402 domain-containing protein [Gemmatimonadota bacterium]|nr:DUF4402 domain-containing protein [Gemmatimonadota bacterium]
MALAYRRIWLLGQLILAGGIALPAHAQSSASGSIAITARVVTPLVLIVSHPLDFGRLLVSTSKTIAPSAATSGRFELVGQGGSSISVTLSMPSVLNPTAGANLPITAWTYVASDGPALTGTAVSFPAGTTPPIPLTFENVAGSTKMYFAIGATATASAQAPTGNYTGTGQITAAYTDL